jgi:hypothetical protein
MKENVGHAAFVVNLLFAASAVASVETIGPLGINSAGLTTANGLPLNGGAVGTHSPIAIGQVELFRPGDPDFDTNQAYYNASVNPAGVYFLTAGAPPTFNAQADDQTEIGPPPYPLAANAGQHAVGVAGIMISTAADAPPMPSTPTGVAPAARLYSEGIPNSANSAEEAAIAMQHLVTLPGIDIRALNYSVLTPLPSGGDTDGNTVLTQFVDWSAHEHDVLYVLIGTQTSTTNPVPTDNFNGITVGASSQVGGTGKY